MKPLLPFIICLALFAASARAQLFNFTTIAGSAAQGNVDGVTNLSQFNNPGGVTMDASGNIYVADSGDDTVRKIAPNGTVSTLAGFPGVSGSADGNGTNALFNAPQGIAVDGSGNVYVADTGNDTIRRITPAGAVSTLAGFAGNPGGANGLGTNAQFYEPEGIAVDASSNVFVADTWNDTIREVTPAGVVTTLAGAAGDFGSTNATGTNALFYEPGGVAVDSSDDVFVADTGNNVIREIAANGAVTTLAGSAGNFGDANGTNALFNAPQGISIDSSGNLYVADYLNNSIREITPAGAVTTLAGSAGNFGSANGAGTNGLFWGPQGIAVNPANNSFIYVADTGNSTIRQLMSSGQTWTVSTIAGDASAGSTDAAGQTARFFWPMDVASDGQGNFYVADAQNNTIRKIAANGTVSTFAGFPGVSGSANANGTNASFNAPQAVAVDSSGNVYVADAGNSMIREITSSGTVSTLAGSAGNTGSSDGTGTNAQFYEPEGIAVNGSGDVFVADTFNHTIREIAPGGVVTTFAGVAGNFGSGDGTNSAAQFDRPEGLAMDSNGNLFVADTFNHTIREITPAGVVSTLAGLARVFGDSDGTNGAARFFEPEGIAVGTGIYVADAGNYSIRQLTPAGTNWVVTTIAGWPGLSGSADGSGIGARFCYPAGMAVSAGNLVVADSANNTIRSGSMITDNPPTISSQPQSQSVNAGNPVTFTVSASGQGTLYYQWQFDGANIAGATSPTYSLSSAQSGNAGDYSVLVISATGSTFSSNALLTVYAPPTITTQPVSQNCLQGATVTFSVTAGPLPLTYQWEENGRPLSNSATVSGVNTATLTLNNVTTASTASYSVVVNNGYGAVASSAATLTVFFVPPPDSIQPYAWWQLNEGTGTVAYDYSGNGHYGTLDSGTSWTNAGHSGNGVYFNATEFSLISINNPFTLARTTSWTAAMWVNRWESRSASTLISGTSDALKLEQYEESSQVGYTFYTHADYTLPYTTPLDAWVHLAFVGTSSGVSLYTNGVLATSLADPVALNAVALGCDDNTVYSDYLDCTLDDVRIYNQALTQQQIANIYAYGRISPIPAITLTAPTNGASYIVSTNITLAANIVSNGLSLTTVQFYAGTNLLGTTTTAPYTWIWTNVLMGNYSLTAAAVYNGATNASPPVGIWVTPATNQPALAVSETGGTLQLSWPADHTGWLLQAQTNANTVGLSTNWTTVTNSITTNGMMIPVQTGNGSAFYRLIYP